MNVRRAAVCLMFGVGAVAPSIGTAQWAVTDVGDGLSAGVRSLNLAAGGVEDAAHMTVQVPSRNPDGSITYPAFWGRIAPNRELFDGVELTSQPGAYPMVATDPSGAAIVVWRQRDGLHARRMNEDGSVSDDTLIMPLANGQTIGTWRVSAEGPENGAVLATVTNAGSPVRQLKVVGYDFRGWKTPLTLASAVKFHAITVASNADTESHALWSELTRTGATRIRRSIGEAGVFKPPSIVSTGSARWVGVAIGDGIAPQVTVAWVTNTASRTLIARTRTSGWGPKVVLGKNATRAAIDGDTTGRVSVTWPYVDGKYVGAWVKTGNRGKWAPGARRYVTLSGGVIRDLDVDVNPRGEGVVGFQAVSASVNRALNVSFRMSEGSRTYSASPEVRQVVRPAGLPITGVSAVARSPEGQSYATHPIRTGTCCFTLRVAQTEARQAPRLTDVAVSAGEIDPTDDSVAVDLAFTQDVAGPVVISLGAPGFLPGETFIWKGDAGRNEITIPGWQRNGERILIAVGVRALDGAWDPGSVAAEMTLPGGGGLMERRADATQRAAGRAKLAWRVRSTADAPAASQ